MGTAIEEKSEFLKECIADAFFRLLRKKNLNKITVNDIVTTAGVGRMNYFRNFDSRYEIIQFKLKCLSKEYYSSLPKKPNTEAESAFHLLNWIYTYKDIFYILNKQSPLLIFLYFSHNALLDSKGAKEDTYKIPFFTGGISAVLSAWTENNFKETPEEIFSLMKQWLILES